MPGFDRAGAEIVRFGRTGLVNARMVANRYQLVRLLGRGGMGTVWLAEDPLARRTVAVKELRAPEGLSAAERDVMGKRALQEARSAAQILHPNAVTLFDVIPASADDDAIYLIMEYVDGMTLAQAMQQGGRIGERQATALCLQLLSVLAEAHELGIVHRDIKPSNIILTKSGQAKLADFGIAHTTGATRLTGSGVMGTPSYMAPELFDSGTITPAADVWSLGATFYHAVEGRSPFDRETSGATLRAILLDPLPAITSAGPLGAAITGMLNRDPADRITVPQARRLLEGTAGAREYQPTEAVRSGGAPPGQQGVMRPRAQAGGQEAGTRVGPAGQRPAEVPPVTGTVFTNAPGGGKHGGKHGARIGCLVLVLTIGAIALGALAGSPFITVAAIVFLCAAWFVYRCAAWFVYRASRGRYRLLRVTQTALVKEGGGPARAIPWPEITQIGPAYEEGQAHLYAWLKKGNERVRLCPLEQPDFPPTEIRAAILTYCPTVNIGPM